jgi:signal peptide peptidase SppA
MSNTAHQLRRLFTEFLETPWALLPAKLAVVLSLLEVRATGQRLDPEDVRAAIGARDALLPRGGPPGVAVLPLVGMLGQRMNLPLQMSGGTSTELFGLAFRQAVADPRISAIVLAIDSPGGSCYGTDELATAIRAARGRKPIVAAVSSLAASAAYWVASQADRIVCTPGGDVGHIGVITAHQDVSGAEAKAGITTTVIAAGKHKADGNPFQPLTDDARADLQRRVDACYRRFVAAVAAGRGVTEATVRDGYGEGRLLGAREALAAGMIDQIAVLDDVVADLAVRAGASVPASRSASAIRQNRREPVARQELALDTWRRKVALDLRLLDL